MKKTISIIFVLILITSSMTACVGAPKDADYLYNWLTEHGTLVSGTRLQYSGTNSEGERFFLCYDTNRTENRKWYVTYETEHILGYKIETELVLFCEDSKTSMYITAWGRDNYSEYHRIREYSHKPKVFTKNSPIEYEDSYGSTVHVPDAEKNLISEVSALDTICSKNAQKNLCTILDWLKESFCPTAKMKMSDFGYDNY